MKTVIPAKAGIQTDPSCVEDSWVGPQPALGQLRDLI